MKYIEKLVKWSKGITIALLFVILSTGMVYSTPHNVEFKNWCVSTFNHGAEIYEAYRTITFDIIYKTELRGDYWQTPEETQFLRTGDCEDNMILFSSLLPLNLENVEIVWGYVYTDLGQVAKHVYGRLISKQGQEYVLVNLSNVWWNGIISSKRISHFEVTTPILVLSQSSYNEILALFAESERFSVSLYKQAVDLLPDSNIKFDNLHEVFYIFESLHRLFSE